MTTTFHRPATVRDEIMGRYQMPRSTWYWHLERHLPLAVYQGRKRVWTEEQYQEINEYFETLKGVHTTQ